jgi:uncharacterized membrane protein
VPYKNSAITEFIYHLPLFIITALVASLGAIVSYLAKATSSFSWRRLVVKWLIGLFVGGIVGLLLMCTDIPVAMSAAIGGLAGSNAEEILMILTERVNLLVKKLL